MKVINLLILFPNKIDLGGRMNSFTPKQKENLKNYIYCLIDPRDKQTFYIGRGAGDRVFQHVKAAVNGNNLLVDSNLEGSKKEKLNTKSAKLKKIKEIIDSGYEIDYLIHRQGMNTREAQEVEAALIDYQAQIESLPTLTNLVGGKGSSERGSKRLIDIQRQYPVSKLKAMHNLILFKIDNAMDNDKKSPYDATRFAWGVNLDRAKKQSYALGIYKQQVEIIIELRPESWKRATKENFPNMKSNGTTDLKYGLFGKEVKEGPIYDLYHNKHMKMPQKGFTYLEPKDKPEVEI